MPSSTQVTDLKINTLTEAQYDTAVQQGVIGSNELSIITDADSGAIQVDTMPTADASLVGKIYQYVGATGAYTNGYFYKCSTVVIPASATGTQTVGTGLTNITVNISTYESAATTYNIDLTQPAVFSFEDDGLTGSWYYGNTEIGYWIDDIGISTDGSPTFGDEITVVYTPASSGYAWLQQNTQPADFVPLTGGTMSGSLRFVNTDLNMHGAIFGHADGVKFGSVAPDGVTVTTIGGWVSYGILPAQNATQNVGSGSVKWNKIFVTRINNGEDIAIPAMYGTMGIQVSSFPTADSTHEGQIYQFTGATDSTYTNGHFYKCVSDGQNPATYSWEEVSLGGASYTAGNGISIDANNEISVTDPVLVNSDTTSQQNCIGIVKTTTAATGTNANGSVIIGYAAYSNGPGGISLGGQAKVNNNNGIAIGFTARADGLSSVAIGANSFANANGAIQIVAGWNVSGTNADADTLKVANRNGNFELMNANGNLPADRLASTTGLADGNYRLRLTMASGVATLSWVAE